MRDVARCTRWTLVSLLTLLAWRAEAQTPAPVLGEKGHFAISAERMFGYVHTKLTQTTAGVGDTTTTNNAFSLFGTPLTGVASVYTFPRVGFDGFIAPGVSLGASASYFHLSESFAAAAGQNDATISGFVLAPRIGFAAALSPVVSIWPRAGVTYVNASTDTGSGPTAQTSSISLVAATLEVPLAVALIPQVTLLIGPTIDLAVSGTSKSSFGGMSTSRNAKETDFGLHAGLLILL